MLNGIFTCLYRCLYRGFILTIFFLIVSHFLLCNCPLFFLLCSMAYLHAFMPGHFFPINSWRYSLNSFSSPSVHWIRVTIKEIWKQSLKNFMQRKKLIHKLSILIFGKCLTKKSYNCYIDHHAMLKLLVHTESYQN